jgi:hypothetical protein
MQEFLKFLSDLNWSVILTIIGAFWYLKKDIRKDIEAIHKDIASIHKEFKFINIRLSRVEGTIYGKDIYKVDKKDE